MIPIQALAAFAVCFALAFTVSFCTPHHQPVLAKCASPTGYASYYIKPKKEWM